MGKTGRSWEAERAPGFSLVESVEVALEDALAHGGRCAPTGALARSSKHRRASPALVSNGRRGRLAHRRRGAGACRHLRHGGQNHRVALRGGVCYLRLYLVCI